MIDLLIKVKQYIEEAEETKEFEYGRCRTAEELISCCNMPDIYNEVITEIKKIEEEKK